LQHPYLVELIQGPLPPFHASWHALLSQLIQIIQQNSTITTGTLLEYWRGQKEENFMAKLAHWEHMVPDAGLKNAFLGAIRQLTLLSFDEEINRSLAKATQEGLTEDEKLELSMWIGKKKRL
jgi:DNA primase